jgi:hypothetical protein
MSETMSEPDLIDRMAALARQMVGDLKSLSMAAADRVDNDTYTAEVMTEAASKLAAIIARGWSDLSGVALDRLTDDKAALPPAVVNPIADRTAALAPLRPTRTTSAEPMRVTASGLGSSIRVLSELANLTFHQNLNGVKSAVDKQVPDYASVVTTHMTEVARRAADQARTVIDDAAEKLDGDGYSPDDWAKTMVKLSDIVLINGIELLGTAVVGPGRYETEPITSDPFTIAHINPQQQHRLGLTAPLSLAGGGHEVTEDCVVFDPADCLLPAGTDTFRIRVKTAGLPSGIYVGAVFAVPLDSSGTPAEGDRVGDEIVPVIIGL